MHTKIDLTHRPEPGNFVQVHYHNGLKNGSTMLYGIVTFAGPKTFEVRWESDMRQRFRYEDPKGVEMVTYDVLDRAGRRRLGRPFVDQRNWEEFELAMVAA